MPRGQAARLAAATAPVPYACSPRNIDHVQSSFVSDWHGRDWGRPTINYTDLYITCKHCQNGLHITILEFRQLTLQFIDSILLYNDFRTSLFRRYTVLHISPEIKVTLYRDHNQVKLDVKIFALDEAFCFLCTICRCGVVG